MKIGILTYHRAYNYGAYLQACSLCNRINLEDDFEAEIIDYRMEVEQQQYDIHLFSGKRKALLLIKGRYLYYKRLCKEFEKAQNDKIMKKSISAITSNSIEDFTEMIKDQYDVIITGSDEIWKVNNFRGFPNPYWLIGDLGCRKFSYAASSRINISDVLNTSQIDLLRTVLEEYEYISVRDEATKKEIEKLTNNSRRISILPDPSFLYDYDLQKTDVLSKIRKYKRYKEKRKTILVMVNNRKLAKNIHLCLHSTYNLISIYNSYPYYINISNISPMEWLRMIKDADYIISSFFHAICFSILYNKSFVAIGTNNEKASKLAYLCNCDILRDRYISWNNDSIDFQKVVNLSNENVNYDKYVSRCRDEFQVFLEALRKK